MTESENALYDNCVLCIGVSNVRNEMPKFQKLYFTKILQIIDLLNIYQMDIL